MANETQSPTQIAHILFLDIVGWSRESINKQGQLLAELSRLVTESDTYRRVQAAGELLAFPSGDGMWILFKNDLSAPAQCAAELGRHLRLTPSLAVRMGIHSGPVRFQTDIAGTQTVVGDGINMAKRVMDMGDDGHIVLSSQYAAWLKQFDEWADLVKPLGSGQTKHGEKLELFTLVSDSFGRADASSHVARPSEPITPAPTTKPLRLVIVYKRNTHPDDQILAALESALASDGHDLFVDRHLKIGVEWARAIEEKIRAADAVIAIVSDASIGSEMLEYEIETAYDEHKKRGKPYLLPVRVGTDKAIDGQLGAFINGLNFSVWHGPQDSRKVITEIRTAIRDEPKPATTERQLEPVGGAVPPNSAFYAERASDAEFSMALTANESIILVKGPRQMGKTSLIGRGIKSVREKGWRHISTDFQKLSTAQMGSADGFYRLVAATLARQLKFKYDFEAEWVEMFGGNMNMDNFVRAMIEDSYEPIVWFMDEADKLFGESFAVDFFGLVRSWHNSRATEADSVWDRFTIVIGYATEAHLFIQDLNQSPFNVGRQIPLQPFNLDQTWDLNERYGSPLRLPTEAESLHTLVGGQPFLTRRALDVLARKQMDFPTLIATADHDDGAFGDHLKRILISVTQLPSVLQALKNSLTQPDLTVQTDGFQRLLAAGVLKQENGRIVLVCDLYRRYLSAHV